MGRWWVQLIVNEKQKVKGCGQVGSISVTGLWGIIGKSEFFNLSRNKEFPGSVYLAFWHVRRSVRSRNVENCLSCGFTSILAPDFLIQCSELGGNGGRGRFGTALWWTQGRRSRDLWPCPGRIRLYTWCRGGDHSTQLCELKKGYPKAFLIHPEWLMFPCIRGSRLVPRQTSSWRPRLRGSVPVTGRCHLLRVAFKVTMMWDPKNMCCLRNLEGN